MKSIAAALKTPLSEIEISSDSGTEFSQKILENAQIKDFRPKVNTKYNKKRDLGTFWERQKNRVDKVKEKNSQILKEAVTYNFKPKLCDNSLKIANETQGTKFNWRSLQNEPVIDNKESLDNVTYSHPYESNKESSKMPNDKALFLKANSNDKTNVRKAYIKENKVNKISYY